MARYELHGIWASGPCYKVGLMLALAGEAFDYVHVDLPGKAQKTPDYLARNRFGVVPCLVDKQTGETLCQSASILEHIAEASGKFLGANARERRQAREWSYWGWDRLARGIYRPRAYKFGFWKTSEEIAAHYADEGRAGLAVLEEALADKQWLVGASPTFADIDLYGVVAYAPQAGLDLGAYPNLKGWMARIEALPGFKGPDALLPKQSQAA
ncbi:MAG: glutathione S-transferase family protein [Hyphomonadaceae bacterium]|nr:glutathione S-transferase family protein [Hyphomonadaceae bacterium]